MAEKTDPGATGPLFPRGVRQLAQDVLAADTRFGETLVREGVLSRQQIEEAVASQRALRSQGTTMRLGEVLVAKHVLSPEQVRQFLHLADKRLLHCAKCGKNFNVKNWRSGAEVTCPLCSAPLAEPPSDRTIDAHGTKTLSPGEVAEARDQMGQPFGRYRLLKELGRGGMGVVWKAWDTQLKRVVALKQILAAGEVDRERVERFLREARLAAKLRHPGIVGVHDVGAHEGQPFFTTDYIQGESLEEATKKGVALRQALLWTKAVAEALAYAHEEGVVHRDVKPANVLVDGKGRPYVMDFGLAKEVDLSTKEGARRASLTAAGAVMGTPVYMSPEQASGRTEALGPATDQFSLGVMLYQMITKRLPFSGHSLGELFIAIMHSDPVAPSRVNRRVHRDIETICMKALEKDPSKRYPSLSDLAADIGCYLEGEPIHARPIGRAERLWRAARKRRGMVIPSAAAGLLALAFIGWVGWQSRSTRLAVERGLSDASGFEQQGEWGKARDKYAAVQELDGENAAAKIGYGRAVDELKRAEEALKSRSAEAESSRASQDDAMKLLEAGRPALDIAYRYLHSKSARYDELVKRVEAGQGLIEQALAKAPRLPLGHYLLGRAWELQGWDDRADACWRKAVEYDPGFAPAHFALGRLLVERSFIASVGGSGLREDLRAGEAKRLAAEASEEFKAASSVGALDDPVQREVARALEAFAKGDSYAVRVITDERSLAKFGDVDGVEDLYWLHAVNVEGAEVVQWCDRALALRPKHPLALFTRGNERRRAGDLKGAMDDFGEALSLSPRFLPALVNRGVAHDKNGDFEEALADYTRVLDIRPEFPMVLANRGSLRASMGRFDEAIEDCDAAIRIDPRYDDGFYQRACSHHDWGDRLSDEGHKTEAEAEWDKAIADFAATLAIDGRHAKALLGRGEVRKHKGDYETARVDFDAGLAIDPRNPNGYAGRATVRRLVGDFDGAIADFQRALDLAPPGWPHRDDTVAKMESARKASGPRDADGFFERGRTREQAGDLEGAIADYTEVLRLDPKDEDALVQRAQARRNHADLKGALEDLTSALALRPDDYEALALRGGVRQLLSDGEGAAADYRSALAAAPRDWPIRQRIEDALKGARLPAVAAAEEIARRGNQRYEKGDYSGAIADYTEALRATPWNAGLYYNRGNARYALGDAEGALADFTESIRIDPRNADAFNHRGVMRSITGDAKGAMEDFDEALRLNPRFAKALNNRANVKQGLGDPEGAMADYNEAANCDPDYAPTFRNRGDLLLDRGDSDAAIADFSEALRLDPRFVEALNGRGHARTSKGDYDGALVDFDEALRLAPEDGTVLFNRGLLHRGRGNFFAQTGAREEASAEYDKAEADLQRALGLAPLDGSERTRIERALESVRQARGESK